MTNLTKHYYVSRPHAPGEIAAALVGRRLTSANRIGKMLWFETDDGDGPDLGIHLGMAGRIAIDEDVNDRWDRFALTFDDGGRVALRDKRRLGRAVLEPEIEKLGPDAALATRAEFRRWVGHSGASIKARIMDQSVIAGIVNLLADEILWQARIDPRRPATARAAERPCPVPGSAAAPHTGARRSSARAEARCRRPC